MKIEEKSEVGKARREPQTQKEFGNTAIVELDMRESALRRRG